MNGEFATAPTTSLPSSALISNICEILSFTSVCVFIFLAICASVLNRGRRTPPPNIGTGSIATVTEQGTVLAQAGPSKASVFRRRTASERAIENWTMLDACGWICSKNAAAGLLSTGLWILDLCDHVVGIKKERNSRNRELK